MSDVVQLVYL